jgi:hypothetical protein
LLFIIDLAFICISGGPTKVETVVESPKDLNSTAGHSVAGIVGEPLENGKPTFN